MMNVERMSATFDEARFSDGLPQAEVNATIRRVYENGEHDVAPFAVTRARMLACALENVRLAVGRNDTFAGVVERHYLDSRYGVGEIARIQGERAEAVARRDFPEGFARTNSAWAEGRFFTQADLSHTSPDWERILSLGIPGLLAEAEVRHTVRPTPFTESVVIACHAFHDFALRFASVCDREGRHDLATELSALAARPPETLHEALQLAILYWHVQEIEGEWVRSFGLFDRQYLPFLERDLAAGRLTEASAEKMLVSFFGFFHAESKGRDAGAPFCFGGYLPGEPLRDGCNRLTRLAWRAFRTLGTPSPKFSIRVNTDTPHELLRFAAECIQEGKNSMVFANEPLMRKAMLRRGKGPADLANFIPIGCYEPAIMGKGAAVSGTVAGPGALTATGGFLPGGPDTIGTMTVSDGATLVGDVALDFAADGTCDQIVFAPGGTYDVSGIRLVPSASGASAWKAAKCFVFGSAADAELTGDFDLSAISGARIKHLDNGNLELSVPGAFVVIVR